MFPLATSVTWVFVGRFIDRIGKGIRGAPRDALIADITPAALRGAAYGLRQSLDSVGAFVGPLLAVVMMGTESRGASNAKAKRELGWKPRYPSWRQGFVASYASG